MKVKIGDKIYDGDEEPVMVILTSKDKELIAAMRSDNAKYCQYPDEKEWTDNEYEGIKRWMADE